VAKAAAQISSAKPVKTNLFIFLSLQECLYLRPWAQKPAYWSISQTSRILGNAY
jgi:hypothetical protein